ncbi:hypothetical protein [Roseimaritima ulvae]|nr:hypothetical protein [Roseimaritima ulvae]
MPKFSRRRSASLAASETEPAVGLSFCNEAQRYAGGDTLEVDWCIHQPAARSSAANAAAMDSSVIQGIEASVMWFTEGKGDEDFKVHYFRRYGAAELAAMNLAEPQRLRTELPYSPLSYEGQLLRIRWCVRLRLFMQGGDEVVAQHPFLLTAAHAIA